MPHIKLPEGAPGIRSLAMYRELIAYVSSLNDCTFCTHSHAAAARELIGKTPDVVDCVLDHKPTGLIRDEMKSLLTIAAKAQSSGKSVNTEDIEEARSRPRHPRHRTHRSCVLPV